MPTPLRVQTDRAIELRIKEQTDPDVIQTGAGAEVLRFAQSSGFSFNKARIASRESRNDGKARRGRHGRGQCEFAVNNDFVIGAYNTPIAATLRNTMAAAVTVTEADLGNATVPGGSGVVNFVNNQVLTFGVRRGDVHVYTAGINAADRNQNLVVIAATANSITYHKSLTAQAAGTFSFNRRKRLIQSNQDIAFTGEEYRQQLDRSEVANYLRFGAWTMSLSPDSNIDIGFTGMGRVKTNELSGASPIFTNPTRPPGIGLVAPNARFYIVGLGFLRLSAFSLNFDIQLSREDSIDPIPYEIIPGQPQISAQITHIETDLELEDDYLAETELQGFLMIEEPAPSGVKHCFTTWFENFTLNTPSKSGLGADRSSSRTYSIDPDVNENGGDAAETNLVVCSSL